MRSCWGRTRCSVKGDGWGAREKESEGGMWIAQRLDSDFDIEMIRRTRHDDFDFTGGVRLP